MPLAGQPDQPYRERLWPSPAIWALAPGAGLGLGLVTTPIAAGVGVAVAAAGTLVTLWVLVATSPVVAVDAGVLRAGRASVPIELVGVAERCGPAQMRAARGAELDARAYLCLRGWLAEGVRAPLLDPADSTPYWLVSSRRPALLAAAINQCDR